MTSGKKCVYRQVRIDRTTRGSGSGKFVDYCTRRRKECNKCIKKDTGGDSLDGN